MLGDAPWLCWGPRAPFGRVMTDVSRDTPHRVLTAVARMQNLGPRLSALVAAVPPGARVLDVGCDHAYVAAALAMRGDVARVVAGDVAEGAVRAAQKTRAELGLEHCVEVRLGTGLQVLDVDAQDAPDAIDTVVVAGMGGHLMRKIVADRLDRARGLSRLILQPNRSAAQLRVWLAKSGFVCTADRLVREGHHIYPTLVLRPAHPDERVPVPVGLDARFGTDERTRPSALYAALLSETLQHVQDALSMATTDGRPAPVKLTDEHTTLTEEAARVRAVRAAAESNS